MTKNLYKSFTYTNSRRINEENETAGVMEIIFRKALPSIELVIKLKTYLAVSLSNSLKFSGPNFSNKLVNICAYTKPQGIKPASLDSIITNK